MPTALKDRFLAAMRDAHRMVQEHGPRSPEKTKILHGWVQDELRRELGDAYGVTDPRTLDVSDGSKKALANELSIGRFFPNISRRIELRHRSP